MEPMGTLGVFLTYPFCCHTFPAAGPEALAWFLPDEGRAGQGRAGQGRAGQGRAGQGKGRAGQGKATHDNRSYSTCKAKKQAFRR
ncbi:MAG: hypothetical protein FRX49_09280 [Trebouxia sp. A1-2]|nr:MAG: hypothetical protein FRX49_09280 [Trebouxia sp. A1-2]